MMDLNGPKHVEELCKITIITRVHLVGFNSDGCLTMHGTNDIKYAESSINHSFFFICNDAVQRVNGENYIMRS